jgi:phosphoglycerate dehydrogenase-like enzyme
MTEVLRASLMSMMPNGFSPTPMGVFMQRLRGLFLADDATFDLVYGPAEQRAIAKHVEMVAPRQTVNSIELNPHLLQSVEVIFSGWTPPRFDDAFFDKAPNLKAIFYAGGYLEVADSAIQRGIVVTTAHVANSQPVAEYTLATILFSLKHGWQLARQTRERRTFVERNGAPGCYGTTVGIISLGVIARMLLKLLVPFDMNVVVYDPFLTAAQATDLGAENVPLNDLFRRADVVSLQSPLLPETEGMITYLHLASMKEGATFINTARGAIVREQEMIQVARERPDLQFVLDVTDPQEPPRPDCPLYELPNVVLTPHIAGSAGGECRRMGRYMVEELERFVEGKPLKWEITPRTIQVTVNRPFVSHASAVAARSKNGTVQPGAFVQRTSIAAP